MSYLYFRSILILYLKSIICRAREMTQLSSCCVDVRIWAWIPRSHVKVGLGACVYNPRPTRTRGEVESSSEACQTAGLGFYKQQLKEERISGWRGWTDIHASPLISTFTLWHRCVYTLTRMCMQTDRQTTDIHTQTFFRPTFNPWKAASTGLFSFYF